MSRTYHMSDKWSHNKNYEFKKMATVAAGINDYT